MMGYGAKSGPSNDAPMKGWSTKTMSGKPFQHEPNTQSRPLSDLEPPMGMPNAWSGASDKKGGV
jgi:hypothetical protein